MSESLPVLTITPEPSRLVAVAIVAVHGGALASVVAVLPQVPWLLVLAVAVAVSCVRSLGEHVSRDRAGSLVRVVHTAAGDWYAISRSGERTALQLASALVYPWLTVLRWRGGRVLVLGPGSIGAAQRSRLHFLLEAERPQEPGLSTVSTGAAVGSGRGKSRL